jgi:hypothetical protein
LAGEADTQEFTYDDKEGATPDEITGTGFLAAFANSSCDSNPGCQLYITDTDTSNGGPCEIVSPYIEDTKITVESGCLSQDEAADSSTITIYDTVFYVMADSGKTAFHSGDELNSPDSAYYDICVRLVCNYDGYWTEWDRTGITGDGAGGTVWNYWVDGGSPD